MSLEPKATTEGEAHHVRPPDQVRRHPRMPSMLWRRKGSISSLWGAISRYHARWSCATKSCEAVWCECFTVGDWHRAAACLEVRGRCQHGQRPQGSVAHQLVGMCSSSADNLHTQSCGRARECWQCCRYMCGIYLRMKRRRGEGSRSGDCRLSIKSYYGSDLYML